MSTETNFRNTKFTVSETVLLSQSTWEYGEGFKFSVALFRKVGSAWAFDQESITEGGFWPKTAAKSSAKDAKIRRDYAVIDFSYPLLKQEMGEVPVRFYRDNVRGKR